MSDKLDRKKSAKTSKRKKSSKITEEEVPMESQPADVPDTPKTYPTAVPQLSEEEEVNSVTETDLQKDDVFQKISAVSLSSFGKILDQNQTLGITFSKPELVFIGKPNTGKLPSLNLS